MGANVNLSEVFSYFRNSESLSLLRHIEKNILNTMFSAFFCSIFKCTRCKHGLFHHFLLARRKISERINILHFQKQLVSANVGELLFELLKSKYSSVFYLKNSLDFEMIAYFVEKSDGKLMDDCENRVHFFKFFSKSDWMAGK